MDRPPPPAYPEKPTIALFGRNVQFKNTIGNKILNRTDAFVTTSNNLVVIDDPTFKIINTPDLFDENAHHPDQQTIDFMATSHPGPHLFMLAIDSENTQEEKVIAQIIKLQETFGGNMTSHLVIIFPDSKSSSQLRHLKEMFKVPLTDGNENVAEECKEWCRNRQSFLYDYKNYSHDVVIRRKKTLEQRRCNPPHDPMRAGAAPSSLPNSQHGSAAMTTLQTANSADNPFSIILLGLTGTGKSASGNTILAAGHSKQDSSQFFVSVPSSLPVTKQCDVRFTKKPFGVSVRVVDTPDFFHEQLRNTQAQVDECRKYCQPGQCVVLLVLQLGRFTDAERGILERLEREMGWNIRENTIVVLTHGEDLKGNLNQHIFANDALRHVIEMCGFRYHLFFNNSKDTKQVTELIKKIPNYKSLFPEFPKKSNRLFC